MKFPILITSLLIITVSGIAQSKLEFETGVRLRVTPIYLKLNTDAVVSDIPFLMQQDAHISGLAVLGGLKYHVSEKIFLGYRMHLRYDEMYAEITSNSTLNEYKNALLLDHSFSTMYEVYRKNKFSIDAGLGISFNNNNSQYSYSYYRTNPINGGMDKFSTSGDFKFTTLDLPLNFSFEKVTLNFTGSITMKHKFFLQTRDFVLLNLSGIYSFNLKKSKDKK